MLMTIPRMFDFHTKLKHDFVIDLYVIKKKVHLSGFSGWQEGVFLFINQKVYCAEWKLSICIYQNQAYLQVKGTIMSLKSPEQKSGHLVLPGERLGVIEEFIPDSGTYVKDGVIFSKIVGRSLMDLQNRRVSVYPVVKVLWYRKLEPSSSGKLATHNLTTF